MKYRILPIIAGLAVTLSTGCSKSASDVQIISAVYGTYTNYADVSYRVRDLVHLGSGFEVDPKFLQADPMPYYNKALVIVYEIKGQRHIFTAAEGDTVSTTILMAVSRP